jgi:ribosome modulation factor
MRGLFLNSLGKLESAKDKIAKLTADVRNIRKQMKAEGYSKVEVDYALFLNKKKDEPELIEEQRRSRERVAKWMARPEGFQGGLFDGIGDGVDRTPAVDRAFESGKTAGLEGKSASPPHDASTDQGQAWLRGYGDGQAILASGFKPLPPKPGEFQDDAASAKPSMRSRGMPGAKKDGDAVH